MIITSWNSIFLIPQGVGGATGKGAVAGGGAPTSVIGFWLSLKHDRETSRRAGHLHGRSGVRHVIDGLRAHAARKRALRLPQAGDGRGNIRHVTATTFLLLKRPQEVSRLQKQT